MGSTSSSEMLGLPTALLDKLVSDVLKILPSSRVTFLASLGTRIHAAAVRVLFHTLVFPDDRRLFESVSDPGSLRSAVTPLLANPQRYAYAVKKMVVCEPDFVGGAYTNGMSVPPLADPRQGDSSMESTYRPLDAKDVSRILEVCGNLEKLAWESSFPPPDGLCELLVSRNPRLVQFSFFPNSRSSGHSSTRWNLAKWDCPSLPLLSSLPLTSLRLSRLSQAGARSLSVLLSNMGEYSTLEELNIDIVWLDDPLCDRIVEAGGKLLKLRIGTSGTKLTDKGIVTLIEGCETLAEMTLDEVQGRLSRGLWTKPTVFPPNLKHFQIIVDENGPHHSWTKDHLLSLHALPFESLVSLSVGRREALPRLEHAVPVYDAVIDDGLTPKPVPRDFLDRLKDARSLTRFECDWWAWSISDLKVVLEGCSNLEKLKIHLDAPFAKLMGLTSSFAPLTNLHTLSVCINPLHAPGRPPVPLLPFSQPSLPTPRESPVMKAKSVLPQLLDFDQMQTQTCLPNDHMGDPSMPLLRDVKRFVRKCLKLSLLEWYGKCGRGSWIILRTSPTTSKISMNVSIEYASPVISNDVWLAMLREQDMARLASSGWVASKTVREGQSWTGAGAEALEAERVAAQDRDDRESLHLAENGVKERQTRKREGARKARSSTVSTSSSTSGVGDSPFGNQLPTPAKSTHSQSPEQVFSPLMSGYPESPTTAKMLLAVSEDGPGSPTRETSARSGKAMKGRARSMNAIANQNTREANSERVVFPGSGKQMNGPSGDGEGSQRSAKGRGRGGRRSISGDGGGSSNTYARGSGRARRGATRGQTTREG